MKKFIPALIITIAFINSAFAKSDTTLYYMKIVHGINSSNNTEDAIPANGKEDATFVRAVISPNFAVDSLYSVNDYYLNGKLKFTGKSTVGGYEIRLHGSGVDFFANGRRRRICTFDKGIKKGDIFSYFPNGKLNTIKAIPEVDMDNYEGIRRQIRTDAQKRIYDHLIDSVNHLLLKECQDSTGKILAENGNGKWIEFKNDYKNIFAEGSVKEGLEEGEWRGQLNDTIKYNIIYHNGSVLQGKSVSTSGREYPFKEISSLPEFRGGVNALVQYIGHSLRYPADAREKHIQGRVLIQFLINAEGLISDVRVVRSVYPSIDAEAVKSLVHSPPWMPGAAYGIKTNVIYTMPVGFTLANDN